MGIIRGPSTTREASEGSYMPSILVTARQWLIVTMVPQLDEILSYEHKIPVVVDQPLNALSECHVDPFSTRSAEGNPGTKWKPRVIYYFTAAISLRPVNVPPAIYYVLLIILTAGEKPQLGVPSAFNDASNRPLPYLGMCLIMLACKSSCKLRWTCPFFSSSCVPEAPWRGLVLGAWSVSVRCLVWA